MKHIPKVNDDDKEARKKIYSSITYEYENCHSTTMKVYYCWLQIMLFVFVEFLKSILVLDRGENLSPMKILLRF